MTLPAAAKVFPMNAIELNGVARDGRVTVIIPDAYRSA